MAKDPISEGYPLGCMHRQVTPDIERAGSKCTFFIHEIKAFDRGNKDIASKTIVHHVIERNISALMTLPSLHHPFSTSSNQTMDIHSSY